MADMEPGRLYPLAEVEPETVVVSFAGARKRVTLLPGGGYVSEDCE